MPDHFDVVAAGGSDVVAGHACVAATASPLPATPHRYQAGSELFNMIAGGSRFRLSVDVRTGTLLRVVKMVDGRAAEICEFLEIAFDEPVDPALFAPLEQG